MTPRRPGLHSEDVTSRRIVFLIFDGLQPLDLVGPHEVFSHAGVLSPDAGYVCQVAARAAGPVRAASGLLVHAGYSLADLDPVGLDTVVAVGGYGVDLARRDRALVGWLAEAGRTARRVVSVCSGVFLVAAHGAPRHTRRHNSAQSRAVPQYQHRSRDRQRISWGHAWASRQTTSDRPGSLAGSSPSAAGHRNPGASRSVNRFFRLNAPSDPPTSTTQSDS